LGIGTEYEYSKRAVTSTFSLQYPRVILHQDLLVLLETRDDPYKYRLKSSGTTIIVYCILRFDILRLQ